MAETKDELPALTLGALLNLHLPHNAENARITIRIQNPGGLTAHQTVDAVRAGFGIDWEARQLVIMPRQMLTTLTPEQLEELAASARAGQSWHAYQAHKKHEAEKAAMQSMINALLEEVEATKKLAAFGAWCAREFRDHLTDVDGGSAQDAMERLGVIVKRVVTEPCGDGCVCVEYGDFPHDCYVFPDDVSAAIDASLSSGRSGSGDGGMG